MSWEYRSLAQTLALPPHPLREAFEGWCADSWRDLTRMEWSVRFAGDRVLTDRFVHSSRVSSSLSLRARLFALASRTGEPRPFVPMSWPDWNSQVLDKTQIAIVGFAGDDPEADRPAALKVYLGVPGWSAALHELVAPAFGGVPLPPGEPGVMLAAVLWPDRPLAPRLYVFYDGAMLDDPAVAAWLGARLGGPIGALKGYRRIAVALKADREDTVYVRLDARPSQLKTAVEDRATALPLLAERLRRITYCGFPARLMGPNPADLSVYVKIR